MKTRIPVAVAACLLSLSTLTAQELKDTTWSSYGVSFRAPSDITVEDDSEEGYIVSNDTYYITVQLLDGEGFKRNELGDELKTSPTMTRSATSLLSSRSKPRNSTEPKLKGTVKEKPVCTVTSCPKMTAADSMFPSFTNKKETLFRKQF